MTEQQDKEFEILLTLLRAGLWETEIDNLSLFPLNAEQWGRIFTISCEQTVTGLIYRGITYLPESMMPPIEEMVKWVARIDVVERRNNHIVKVLGGLHDFFKRHGLRPIVQKGYGVAQMYEMPMLREAGDIDFWFHADEWDKANMLAQELARHIENMADGSVSYCYQGVEIEHHKKMFDLQNPFKQAYLNRLFGKIDAICEYDMLLGINKPSPLANIVLQNTHILKHSLGLGIGLRQLCDLARTYYTLSAEIDGGQVKCVYEKLGLKRWSRMLHTFLVRCLNLDSQYLPYPIDKDVSITKFTDIIRRGGNFGLYNEQRVAISGTKWGRKMNTFYSFLRGVQFSIYYAPMELVCRVGDLAIGQFKR